MAKGGDSFAPGKLLPLSPIRSFALDSIALLLFSGIYWMLFQSGVCDMEE